MDDSKSGKIETQKNIMKMLNAHIVPHMPKTNEEVEVKFSFKRDGERRGRCKTCMHILCLWREENKEKEPENKKKHYEQNKEKYYVIYVIV